MMLATGWSLKTGKRQGWPNVSLRRDCGGRSAVAAAHSRMPDELTPPGTSTSANARAANSGSVLSCRPAADQARDTVRPSVAKYVGTSAADPSTGRSVPPEKRMTPGRPSTRTENSASLETLHRYEHLRLGAPPGLAPAAASPLHSHSIPVGREGPRPTNGPEPPHTEPPKGRTAGRPGPEPPDARPDRHPRTGTRGGAHLA